MDLIQMLAESMVENARLQERIELLAQFNTDCRNLLRAKDDLIQVRDRFHASQIMELQLQMRRETQKREDRIRQLEKVEREAHEACDAFERLTGVRL